MEHHHHHRSQEQEVHHAAQLSENELAEQLPKLISKLKEDESTKTGDAHNGVF